MHVERVRGTGRKRKRERRREREREGEESVNGCFIPFLPVEAILRLLTPSLCVWGGRGSVWNWVR
jgi:hypothetical protein